MKNPKIVVVVSTILAAKDAESVDPHNMQPHDHAWVGVVCVDEIGEFLNKHYPDHDFDISWDSKPMARHFIALVHNQEETCPAGQFCGVCDIPAQDATNNLRARIEGVLNKINF